MYGFVYLTFVSTGKSWSRQVSSDAGPSSPNLDTKWTPDHVPQPDLLPNPVFAKLSLNGWLSTRIQLEEIGG
jgi:hypothetical protein